MAVIGLQRYRQGSQRFNARNAKILYSWKLDWVDFLAKHLWLRRSALQKYRRDRHCFTQGTQSLFTEFHCVTKNYHRDRNFPPRTTDCYGISLRTKNYRRDRHVSRKGNAKSVSRVHAVFTKISQDRNGSTRETARLSRRFMAVTKIMQGSQFSRKGHKVFLILQNF